MQHWFNQLTKKEQLLIAFCALLLIFYFLYSAAWRPMSISSAELELRNESAGESLVAVNGLVAQYNKLKNTSSSSSGAEKKNLTRLINKLVQSNQLVMKRYQPSSSGDVQIRFENSLFNNVLTLLNQLESENGVLVKSISITRGNTPGLVDVSMRLHDGV